MKPQYRADPIGGFLRPAHLLIARARRQEGRLAADERRRIEDAAIEEMLRMQRAAGAASWNSRSRRQRKFGDGSTDELGVRRIVRSPYQGRRGGRFACPPRPRQSQVTGLRR
jgi:5-methyltetrahydropteroyltriglutamate--homocysteine methyltransferase